MFNRFHYDYCQRIAENWYAIFQELDINQYSIICELSPGWAPKIEIALSQIGFSWKIILVDKQKSFLDELEDNLSIFSPEFDIVKKWENILELVDVRADILIWNHIIDDLILDYYCELEGIDVNNLYYDGNKFVSIRADIQRDSWLVEELVEKLVERFETIINDGGYLLLAQYPGETEKNFGLDISIELCRWMTEKIKVELEKRGFAEDLEIKKKAYKRLETYFFEEKDILILKKVN